MKKYLALLMFCLPLLTWAQTSKDVTFIVDMRDYSGSYTTVNLNGNFNSWCGTCNPMTDPEGDSIWTVTLPLTADSIEYKFTLDGWTGQESLTSGTACTKTTGIYTNRFAVLNGDTILDGVAWEDCSAKAGQVYMTFQVSMIYQTVDASGVYLAGGTGFGLPGDNEMHNIGDSIYSITLPADTGFNSDFTFLNGDNSSWSGKENISGQSCAVAPWNDRTIGGALYSDYRMVTCFGECISGTTCTQPITNPDVTFSVDMNGVTSSFTNVYVSGSLNSWSGNANQLTDADGDGVYEGVINLAAGNYEFKFTYDNWAGQENLDPATTDSVCTLTTGIYTNRYITIGSSDTTLPTFCWEECVACQSTYTPTACGDLFFSEYAEGSSNHKYYEIYNPTGNSVDLSDYEVHLFSNGGTSASQVLDFPSGTLLASGDVYVVANSAADTTILAFADTTSTTTYFNGNDALALLKNTDTLDILGEVGVSSYWTVGTGSMSNNTLVRKATVDMGTTSWTQSSSEWDVYASNTWTYGGAHSSNCIVTPKNVTFQVDMNSVTASYTNVYVSGTVNGWSGNANQLTDPDGDGVYTGTLSLMPGSYEYKFTYDNWAGQENFDPTTLDSNCTLTTGIYTNRYSTFGNADTTLPVVCWESCSSCPVVSTGCDELFFSEYSEGSSNNKYFEIYNPTANAVSLSGYTVYLSGNGGSFTNSFTTNATIASGDVYVAATNQSSTTILAEADTALAFPSVAHFNGDDALILVYGTDTIDVIGVPGVDPGSSWTVDSGSTKDHTLIRKATVSAGQTDWTVGATEWNVHPQNTWSFVGAHTSNCIYTPPAPTFPDVVAINTFNGMDANGVVDSLGAMKWVKVIVTSIDFDGNAGYSFYAEDATDGINIWNFADKSGYTTPMMGDSLYIHGEVAQFRGLTELEPDSIYLVNQNNTLPAASVETALDETTESELIQLIGMTVVDPTQWPASGSSANVDITNGTDTMTMRIDSDTDIDGSTAPAGMFDVTGLGSQFDFSSPYDEGYQIFPRMLTDIYEYPTIPMYQISDVTYVDAAGMPDSLNVMCKLEGIVMGVDMQGSATAVSFTLHDGIDGIGTYGSISNYTVTEGDSVRIIGSIGQYNGLLQMYLDSVVLISSGNALPTTPTVVTALSEATESELIKFENATLVDPSQWSGGSGYSVDITNGTDTIVMRIDADTDIYGTAAPTGAFDVTGIGGQFTFNAGNFDGYQILPRYQADIVPAAAVYVPKIVVSEIMPGSNASSWNADWFEIYNYGDTAVDLAGMSWDDESGISGTSTFPSVTIAPGEAVVVWDDVAANEDSLLVSWKLYPGSVQVISTDELTGSFPSLSQNGDGVYLFDAAGIELTKSEYISGTAGYSIEFDTTGTSLGDAVDGVNGAYTSLNGDVGSPGNLTPNTGAGEFTLNGRIYPNPNTGNFNIEMDRTDNYTVEVMDVRGAVLSRMTVEGNTISVDVNVSAGMYLVRVSSARGTVTQRVQVL
jgi:hypothetical protein